MVATTVIATFGALAFGGGVAILGVMIMVMILAKFLIIEL